LLDQSVLVLFCQAHHIRRLALFGSQLKGTAGPDSDVDLLARADLDRDRMLLFAVVRAIEIVGEAAS